jgi:hypothetical protein
MAKVLLCTYAKDQPNCTALCRRMLVCHHGCMEIFRLLGLNLDKRGGSSTETETVRKITRALDLLEPEHARYVLPSRIC